MYPWVESDVQYDRMINAEVSSNAISARCADHMDHITVICWQHLGLMSTGLRQNTFNFRLNDNPFVLKARLDYGPDTHSTVSHK